MMYNTFRTTFIPSAADFNITHQDRLMLMGSCFAVNIGERLGQHKFDVRVNPFGILFNPASIAQSLQYLCSEKLFTENDLLFHNDEWVSLSHHGDFSHKNKDVCLENINQSLRESRNLLKNADCLILTLGSSIVYRHKETGKIVANCHKIPQNAFEKTMLTTETTSKLLRESIENVRSFNDHLKIILTVSPVRYIKKDMVENSLSKARLICAVHEVMSSLVNISYFPSYEIMMDDLRDYRFYDLDMIHPSKTAILYLWHIFCSMYFGNQTLEINQMLEEINTAMNHRIKNPDTKSSTDFKRVFAQKVKSLQDRHPYLSLRAELEYFQ